MERAYRPFRYKLRQGAPSSTDSAASSIDEASPGPDSEQPMRQTRSSKTFRAAQGDEYSNYELRLSSNDKNPSSCERKAVAENRRQVADVFEIGVSSSPVPNPGNRSSDSGCAKHYTMSAPKSSTVRDRSVHGKNEVRKIIAQQHKALQERIAQELLTGTRLRDKRRQLWAKIDELEQQIHGLHEIANGDNQSNEMANLRLELCEELKLKLSAMHDYLRGIGDQIEKSTLEVGVLLKQKVVLAEQTLGAGQL